MRYLLKKIFSNKILSSRLIKIVLKLHNISYKLAAFFGSSLQGYHPKHDIIKYEEWFKNNINEDDLVLDIGCNTGMMTHSMSFKAKYVYGIEIESKYIKIAKSLRQKENILYICADATCYDYSDLSPISVITLSNVLEHIENRVDFLKNIIGQIQWKKNDNKKILIRVPMIGREWITIYKKNLGVEYRLDDTHHIEYTIEDLENELNLSGIDILSHKINYGEIYALCKVSN